MDTDLIHVELFTIPQAACDSGKANWTKVSEMVKNQLQTKFGNSIEFKHVEFMSEQWFNHDIAQHIIEKGEVNFPFVLVDNEIACADKKINIPKISRAINKLLII